MRKISKQIANAFTSGQTMDMGNSHTDGKSVYLFGNLIAWRSPGNTLELTLAGWPTVTTRDRLNAILQSEGFKINAGESYGYSFEQKDSKQYFVTTVFNGYKSSVSERMPLHNSQIVSLGKKGDL